jgi:extracellular matrix regulatory protein A
MAANFLHVGFSGYVDANSVLAILSPDSAPVRRLIREAESQNKVINMTYGRKTKAVIVHQTGHVTLIALQPETIINRWRNKVAEEAGQSQ